jgi:predicted methyltransferase
MKRAFRLAWFISCASLAACAGTGASAPRSTGPAASRSAPPARPSEFALSIVDAADRTADDRKVDPGRHPAEMLTFFGIGPGQRVADLAAAGGYTTELLARAVGPAGTVYGQNSKWLIERFAERPWSERLARPAMKNVARIDREFEDPFPAEARNLDAVVIVMFYHDLFWLHVDRDKMNQAVYRALKPGGAYDIIDHSGRPGTGATEVDTLHRIDETLVRAEVEKVGFRLRAEGSFLRNRNDTRDWNASPSGPDAPNRGKSDRFALLYEKP